MEAYPPTAADYAQAAADSARDDVKRLQERLDSLGGGPNLRDAFAMHALGPLLQGRAVGFGGEGAIITAARAAYMVADAMMAERKKNAG